MKKAIFTLIIAVLLIGSACSTQTQTTETQTLDETAQTLTVQESTLQASAEQDFSESSSPTEKEPMLLTLETHEDGSDTTWDTASEVAIALMGDTIEAEDSSVTITGSTATITAGGSYHLSGDLTDGQLVVESDSEDLVRLILDDVNISSSTSAAISIENAEEVVIVLAEGSQNSLSDASTYVFPASDAEEPNAALFSKANLSIYGSGSLEVSGNYNDGIASKDGLIIKDTSVTVNAVDDAIRGKDYLVIENADITIHASGDGLKADNDDTENPGSIQINGGCLVIDSNGDAINAQGQVEIISATVDIHTQADSTSLSAGTTSAKGIKGLLSVLILDGMFTLNTADDGIHSNGSIKLEGGVFSITSGDDGMHADSTLTINGGQVDVLASYEGLESNLITINDGIMHITASDDGINASAGSGTADFQGGFQPGNIPPGGGMQAPGGGVQAPGGTFPGGLAEGSGSWLYVNGGYLYVNAGGDGIDVNGSAEINGGTVLVDGPTESMNGAVDYLGTFTIHGGILVAAGSAGMVQAPSQDSSQASILFVFNTVLSDQTLISLESESGSLLLAYAPYKRYQSVLISTPDLQTGSTLNVLLGGNASGEPSNGLYTTGTVSQAEPYTSTTLTSTVNVSGTTGMFGAPSRRH